MIVQQEYSNGKAAYDRQEYVVAARVFKQVLDELADADMSAAANQPPLADIRTLALGFFTLSDKAAAPPPARGPYVPSTVGGGWDRMRRAIPSIAIAPWGETCGITGVVLDSNHVNNWRASASSRHRTFSTAISTALIRPV